MTAPTLAAPVEAEPSSSARSPTAAPPERAPTLETVPRPPEGELVAALGGATAGGLLAVQAEWGLDGGEVVLSGRRPFLDVTGRASFRLDGTLSGDVSMRADVTMFGLSLGEATWAVSGWTSDSPLATPTVRLQGTTLRVDLSGLPREAAFAAAPSLTTTADGTATTVELPGDAIPEGEPLSPRYAELFRGLLGVDVAGLSVHADAPVAGAPAFVSNEDLFFAPGIYGVDSPETLRVLDAAVRAALAGLFGSIGATEAPTPNPPAPEGEPGAPADTSLVPATVPDAAAAESVPAADGPGSAEALAEAGGGAARPDAGVGDAAAAAPAGEAGAAPAADPAANVIMPEAPTAPTPAAAARGGAVAGGAGGAARSATTLPDAQETTDAAHGAVAEPASETAARAQEELAATLGELPAPSPEIVALCERIRTAIRENRPEDEDDLIKSDPTQAAQSAGATITGSVDGQVTEVSGSYDAMATPPSGTPAATPVGVVPPDPSSAGMGVDAASAAPDPIPPENTNLDADVAATDQRIADSGMETRVTAEVHDGPFQAQRDARGELGELAQRTPEEINAEEQTAIDSAQGDMANLQLQAVAAMRAARGRTVGEVGGAQAGTTASEELTRDNISQRAQAVYTQAEHDVGELLTPLTRTAMAQWDAGLARLSREFHDSLDRVQRWIDDRHSGALGTLVAIGDYIGGLPDWVTDEYNRAERAFGDGVCDLLLQISTDVNAVIASARVLIQGARDEINRMFDQIAAEYPDFAATERARFSGMLDGLSTRVTDAQTSFVRDVSSRAITAINEAHATVQAKREEAGGLIGRVVAAIEEFIDDPIRAIINALLRLVGIPPAAFWSLISQIEQVISDIADDPENFINNLTAGVKLGFSQFFDNFGTHLIGAFWNWLFSGLKTPIPMPTSFDPMSLVSFALQLMGITWPNIREILVRHLGPEAVELLEVAWQILSVLITQGPMGLVNMIKDMLSPENIVGMILDAAIDYIVEKLIVKAAEYIFSLLNPVGAVAQAIMLIYRVCSWIFRNAARIFAFVQAVVGGMANVIAGNIGGLAAVVERALASMLVVVIDLFMGLLGLGDLPDEVADVIQRMQAYVLGIIDQVVGFIVTQARALLRRLGVGGDEDEEDGENHNDDDELGTTVRFSATHEAHRTWITREGSDATLMVASTPIAIRDKVTEWQGRVSSGHPENDEDRAEATRLLGVLVGLLDSMDAEADTLAAEFENADRDPRDADEPPSDNSLEGRQRTLASTLRDVFIIMEDVDPAVYMRDMNEALPGHASAYAETVKGQWERDITRAKVAPDGTEAIWDMSVVTITAARQFVVRSATRQSLLPYFLVGSQRGDNRRTAEAGAFANYVFETDSPDPPHVVRAQFLSVLGDEAATRMRAVAQRKVGPEDNATLSTQLQELSFTTSGGRFGAFVGLPVDTVSPLVKTAISRAGGIVPFLRHMVSPGVSDALTYAQFTSVYNGSSATKDYVKGLFRQVEPANHEWIPTGYVPQVLETAVGAANAGDIRKGFQWVTAQNNLRSRTSHVLHPPVVTTTLVPLPDGTHNTVQQVLLSGHVGAFRVVRDGALVTTGTVGTEDFHDWLRNAFTVQQGQGPAGYITFLQGELPGKVWDGGTAMFPPDVLTQQVGMLYRCDDGVDRSLTIGDLALRQRANWQQIQNDFAAARAAVEAEP